MSDNGLREYHGHHVIWCTNRDADLLPEHTDDEPYCSRMLTGVYLIPESGAVKCMAWVSPTNAFTHGLFTPAEYAERERLYDGVEIAIETWLGPDGGAAPDQKIRMTSDAARTLAAALIRAADIEQGLTR